MAQSAETYYDRQEVRNAAEREASIFHALPGLIRHALDNAPHARRRLEGIDPEAITSRAALERIPVLRRDALVGLQAADPPFAGLGATSLGRLARIHAGPGPAFTPEGNRNDYWRFARALFAAGFRAGDIVLNGLPYHLTAMGFMTDAGARALGCPVVPAGDDRIELQAAIAERLRPAAVTGTPGYLERLLERMARDKRQAAMPRKALIAAEPIAAETRDRLRERYGVDAYAAYATTDLGLVAYETPARDGLVVDEALIVEIVEPGGDRPVPQGEVGEIVVTAFNPDYPLIRFATGDLSAVLPGESPCGRTNMRIKGWLGRVDGGAG